MSKILKPLSELEAKYKLEAQATFYNDSVMVFVPRADIYKLYPNLEQQEVLDRINNPSIPKHESNLERSLRRTRKQIKGIVFCNIFDMFATFTMAKDRHKPELVKRRITNWVKNEKKRKGSFQHLIVPEYHKDQKSLHFHALLKGYKGELQPSLKINGQQRRQKGRLVYTLPSYTHGFNNVKLIGEDKTSATKLGFYLQKYITKDMPIFFGKNRYWASHGLKRPVVRDNPEKWYLAFKKDSIVIPNDYGETLIFQRGKNPIVDMFIEANQP